MNNTKLEELKIKFQEIEKTIKEESQKILAELFFEFLINNQEIESISWKQYTMGFNDGDPVYFSNHMYSAEFTLTNETELTEDLSGYERSIDGFDYDKERFNSLSDIQKAQYNNLTEFAGKLDGSETSLMAQLFNTAFGDGTSITASLAEDKTSVKFDTEEYYNHD